MELQNRLINLERIVKELNILYKYCYTEDDLIKLNSEHSIESIDETKCNIESPLFIMIIDAVLEGAIPQDKEVYKIIMAFADVLCLPELTGHDKWQDFINKTQHLWKIKLYQ